MSQILYPPGRPLSIGQVLDTGFRIFQQTLPRCLIYGALYVVASQLPNIYHLAAGRPLGERSWGDPLWWVSYVLGALGSFLLCSCIILRQRAMAEGRATSVSAEVRTAIRRLPQLLLMLILVLAMVGVGLALLVLPGLYLMVALALTWHALLLQDLGPVEAIRYSLGLIRENWWRTAVVFGIGLAVVFMFYGFGLMLAFVIAPFAGAEDIALVTAVSSTIIVAIGAIAVPFGCALLLAVFGDLRVRREGVDLERRIAAASTG